MSNQGSIYIHYFSESSAGQVSLMAYLLGSNLGRPDKTAELMKADSEKIVYNFKTSYFHFNSIVSGYYERATVLKPDTVRLFTFYETFCPLM